jgi:hypothetical protein
MSFRNVGCVQAVLAFRAAISPLIDKANPTFAVSGIHFLRQSAVEFQRTVDPEAEVRFRPSPVSLLRKRWC